MTTYDEELARLDQRLQQRMLEQSTMPAVSIAFGSFVRRAATLNEELRRESAAKRIVTMQTIVHAWRKWLHDTSPDSDNDKRLDRIIGLEHLGTKGVHELAYITRSTNERCTLHLVQYPLSKRMLSFMDVCAMRGPKNEMEEYLQKLTDPTEWDVSFEKHANDRWNAHYVSKR